MNSIDPSARLHESVILGDEIHIGRSVVIEAGAVIHDHVCIGDDSHIGCQCILGEHLSDYYAGGENLPHPLVIGEHALIRSGTIIYGGTRIGSCFQTGHRAVIRESAEIGEHVRIGTMTDVQGHCRIGNYVNIHSGVFLAPDCVIEDYVWLFPHVVLTNDPTPPSETEAGVVIGRFASVAARSLILPGVKIGEEALVAAGSVVTRDVPAGMLAMGMPAKVRGRTENIINPKNGLPAYPWREHFDRGMPWQGMSYRAWVQQCAGLEEKENRHDDGCITDEET